VVVPSHICALWRSAQTETRYSRGALRTHLKRIDAQNFRLTKLAALFAASLVAASASPTAFYTAPLTS
jgi:hypothetical protein